MDELHEAIQEILELLPKVREFELHFRDYSVLPQPGQYPELGYDITTVDKWKNEVSIYVIRR